MTDCPNAEMRDRLPDLLHERLDARTRAVVMAHVDQCADCRVELTVLRETLVALTSGMRSVDVAAIARVVITRTSSPAVVRGPEPRARSTWINWRVAASIAVLVAGGASFAVIRSRQQLTVGPHLPVVASPAPESVPVRIARTPAGQQTHAAPVVLAPASAELSAAGGVGDLSDNDLKVLLDDLQSIDAVPLTEPEPVTVRVAPTGRGSDE